MAKPMCLYQGWDLVCSRSLPKTPVWCVFPVSAQTISSMIVVKLWSWRGIAGTLKLDLSFRCSQCTGRTRSINGKPTAEVSENGRCFTLCILPLILTSITNAMLYGRKFNDLLPILTPFSLTITCKLELKIRASQALWPMQEKPGSQLYLTGIPCSEITGLWPLNCTVPLPMIKSACKISWTSWMQLDDLENILHIHWGGMVTSNTINSSPENATLRVETRPAHMLWTNQIQGV